MGGFNRHANWILQDSVRDTQLDDVAQLENTVNVLSMRVMDSQKTCYDKKRRQCHFGYYSGRFVALLSFIHLEALLCN